MDRKKIIFFAPNIHKGGGLTLLLSLLEKIPDNGNIFFVLDYRAKESLSVFQKNKVYWIRPKILSRLWGELLLFLIPKPHDMVFCFGGIPPIFYFGPSIMVFQQNRNYLGLNKLTDFSARTSCRLFFERILCRLLHKKVHIYVTQTTSMRRQLLAWMPDAKVKIVGFRSKLFSGIISRNAVEWDFIYVSDVEGHKNHHNLLEAWKILARSERFPSLALTVSPDNIEMLEKLNNLRRDFKLQVVNLGIIPHREVWRAYINSGALIFPSKSESFGLPLMEAADLGLPIVASELDYVRDVCVPSETFDPESPLSIARAVERFLKVGQALDQPFTPEEAWASLCAMRPEKH